MNSSYHQIKAVLAPLRMDSSAKVVFLVDKDGQEIAHRAKGKKDGNSEPKSLDTTSLASLGAGNVAATGGMAQLIGEKDFPTLLHEGERESIHICVIGRLLLMVVFDERYSLGLVKLRTTNLQYIFDSTARQARGKLISLATERDRTPFFDFMPVRGFKTRCHLYTVPGRVFYDASRKLILKGVDGASCLWPTRKMNAWMRTLNQSTILKRIFTRKGMT